MDWFNNQGLLEPIGNIPPAEAEQRYYAMLEQPAVAALLKPNSLRRTRGGSHQRQTFGVICDRDEDYANPIEPSVKGGEKIAAAIHPVLAEHYFAAERTHAFVR